MSDYDAIKAQQVHFPLPQPSGTIVVGTLNMPGGAFQYAVPQYSKVVSTPGGTHGGHLKPDRETLHGGVATAINVFTLKLRFNVANRSGDFSVTAGGQTVHAPAGQNWVEIDAGAVSPLSFTLQCGTVAFRPELPLKIDRHMVGAGGITIPALPITILFAPPVDQQKKNVATWTATDLAGTTTTLSLVTQTSTTAPIAAPVMIRPWLELTAEMKYSSLVLSKIPNAAAQAIGSALGAIGGLLGNSVNTGTIGTTVTSQHSITLTLTTADSLATSPTGGGPGHADVLYFLKNARVCWFANEGQIQLAVIGWDAIDNITAALLQEPNGPTGLDDATRAALLKLDPFVAGGSGAVLPAPRFVLLETFDVNAPHTYNLSYTVTNSDLQQSSQMQSEVEDDTASLFAFANVGVLETIKLQSTLTQTSAATSTTTKTITRQVQFFANPNEYYSVEVYSDVIFGTFAFRSLGNGSGQSSLVAGHLLSDRGRPRPFTEVKLSSEGRRYTTVTDANGDFSVRAATLNPRRVELLTKGAVLGPAPLRPPPIH